jgi:hypothetical protein
MGTLNTAGNVVGPSDSLGLINNQSPVPKTAGNESGGIETNRG